MKIIYKLIISISIVFGLLLFNSGNVNADNTITYSNSSILNIDNEHNSISLESPDSGTETIHNVPIKIRSDLQKTINNNKKRYNIKVSNSNNFVSISKAPDYKNAIDITTNFISENMIAPKNDPQINEAGSWMFLVFIGGFLFALVISLIIKKKKVI